jgi:long-chain fatty acid transport protein
MLMAVATMAASVGAGDQAAAGAFALKERSARAQGLSFAGATAGSGGLQSMGFNPAALGLLKSGEGAVAGGLSYVSPIADGDVYLNGVATGQETEPNEPGVVPSFYVGYRMEPDDLMFGLAVTSPFGLKTEYEPGFIGAGDALTSELLSLQFSPTVAFDPLPGLTLAIQGNIFYVDARLTSALVNLEGEETTASFAVGALWQVTDGTTVGLAYDHGYNLELGGAAEGPVTRGFVLPAIAKAQLPATVSLGVVQEMTDQIRLMGELQWQNWSVFDRIDVTIRSPFGSQNIPDPQNYRDAFFVALGAEYDVAPGLTLRAGAAWDQTPTQNSDLAAGFLGRTLRVPDEDRIWLSVGASYDFAEDFTIDAGYSYLFAPEDPVVDLRTVPGGTVVCECGAHIVSVGGSYRF